MFRKLSIVIVLIMAVILTACGSSTPATSVPATATTTAAQPTIEPTAASESTSTTATTSETATCTLLDLNTVTEDQLLSTLPDFSNRMVREFFEYRPYVSIQQFRREIGKYVDDTQVTAWEAFVYVPVDVNNADADTLQQLPGVNAIIAENLIAARPYADNQAFLAALSASVTADEVTVAGCYLVSAA